MLRSLGRNFRLIIFLAVLIFVVPIHFIWKLESIDDPNLTFRTHKKSLHKRTTRDLWNSKQSQGKSINLNPTLGKTLGNYEPVNLFNRSGPGEGGVPVILSVDEGKKAEKTINDYGFNMVASDKISLDRRIKDTRPEECKYWQYPSTQYLPTASVIIVFYDEGWGVLLRTVHSVINTSPKALLKEVVLIDDGSTDNNLKTRLEKYIKHWNGLVKLYRTKNRVGLIEARTIGAKKSTGDVIIILDAHCECVVNWLPPLLTRIALNRKALAIPIVDGLEWNTLEHTNIYGSTNFRGIWEWGFLYKETIVPDKELKKRNYASEPYWSPTHAGGLLAIERKWFFELGAYDPGIRVWGGEQYELSFKVWMCGGVVEWVPCSHVAHAYRGPRNHPSYVPGTSPHQTYINHLRLAHVWMDEYAEYYYRREPSIRSLKYGNISEQKKIKEKLHCKSFKWFMKNIAYDVLEKYPLPSKNIVWGECQNVEHSVCLKSQDIPFGQSIAVAPCYRQKWLNRIFDPYMTGLAVFRLNEAGELSTGEHCFISDSNLVKKKFCLDPQGRWNPVGEWIWNKTSQQILSKNTNTCITTDGRDVKLEICDENKASQKWSWKEFFY